MGDKTGIEWTDATWNPTTGCDRISPGCDHCYALTMAARLKGMGSAKYQNDGNPETSGPGFKLTMHADDYSLMDQPLRWRKPRRIFVNSMSDLFHKDVTDDFLRQVFQVMAEADHHTFQVLTKRPQRMRAFFATETARWATYAAKFDDCPTEAMRTSPAAVIASTWNGDPSPNVWLGTSIENDKYTFRANHLRATPAAVRFLSLEPLLGPLPHLDLTGIDWVIVGGESGPGARPMHLNWVRDLRDRSVAAGVAFHFKQWGSHGPDGTPMNKHAAGRELDGRTWDEWPETVSAVLGSDDTTAREP